MHAAEGILTARGGMTSHAAVVARGMGKPCVAGAGALRVDDASADADASAAQTLEEGRHHHPRRHAPARCCSARCRCVEPRALRRLRHADGLGRRGPHAEGPRQRRHAARRRARRASSAPRASACAAPSTCSSSDDRIVAVREMILADDEAGRRAALAKLLPMQRDDFVELFSDHGRPAGHDPPARPAAARVPAAHATTRSPRSPTALGVAVEQARGAASRELHEFNPMLGHPRLPPRRSPIPRSTEMQARAIFEAAVEVAKKTGAAGGARDHDPAGRRRARSSTSSRRAIDAMAAAVVERDRRARSTTWSAR